MKKKVHPSPLSAHKDAVSVLKILPVAIATLSAALLPEEQEVLAYLIACSCSWPSSLPMYHKTTKANTRNNNRTKRKPSSITTTPQVVTIHKPVFDCRCFECYMSFWSRWDASPNRDLIHKAIDLFDDHMAATRPNTHNAESTFSSSHRQTQTQRCSPVPSAKDGRKNNCEEEVKVGFNKEEGKIKYDNHYHQNGMAARGLIRRMFPNIMGFVEEHIWTVWSPPV